MEPGDEITLRERVYQNLVRRRQNILDGGMNSIPSPFHRFSDDFIGVEPSTYYLVTSFTKGKIFINLNIFLSIRNYSIYFIIEVADFLNTTVGSIRMYIHKKALYKKKYKIYKKLP